MPDGHIDCPVRNHRFHAINMLQRWQCAGESTYSRKLYNADHNVTQMPMVAMARLMMKLMIDL